MRTDPLEVDGGVRVLMVLEKVLEQRTAAHQDKLVDFELSLIFTNQGYIRIIAFKK